VYGHETWWVGSIVNAENFEGHFKVGSLDRLPRGSSDLMLRLFASFLSVCGVCSPMSFGYIVWNGGVHLLVMFFGHCAIPSPGFGHFIFIAMDSSIACAILCTYTTA